MTRPSPTRPERAPQAVAVPAGARRRLVLLGAAVAALLAIVALATLARAEDDTRTIEDIEIEGEVRLPQVLFITSREATRPHDWLDAWPGPAAADIASGAWTPPEIHLLSPVDGAAADAGASETVAPPDPEPVDSEPSPSTTEEDPR